MILSGILKYYNNIFSSAIVVSERSSHIKALSDLKGKRAAINGGNSCSGYLLLAQKLGPQLFDTCEEGTEKKSIS